MESVPFALFAAQVGHVDVNDIGAGIVDDAEFNALDGVGSAIQSQLDSKPLAASVYTKTEVDVFQSTQDAAIATKADSAA